MKVICINVSKKKIRTKFNLIPIPLSLKDENTCFFEIMLSLDFLNKRVFECNKGLLSKIKGKIYDKILISKIKKLKASDRELIYILPKSLDKEYEDGMAANEIKAYLANIMNKLKANIYVYTGNIKKNIYKYIDFEIEKQKLAFEDTKILLLYEDYKNINYGLIEQLIEKYKVVDILCKNFNSDKANKSIEKINNTLGTSISVKSKITKKDLKSLQYCLGICMDANKNKFSLNNMNVIDLSDNDMDKYDEFAIKANKSKIYRKINSEYFTYLSKNYGRLKILSLLCKIENVT